MDTIVQHGVAVIECLVRRVRPQELAVAAAKAFVSSAKLAIYERNNSPLAQSRMRYQRMCLRGQPEKWVYRETTSMVESPRWFDADGRSAILSTMAKPMCTSTTTFTFRRGGASTGTTSGTARPTPGAGA